MAHADSQGIGGGLRETCGEKGKEEQGSPEPRLLAQLGLVRGLVPMVPMQGRNDGEPFPRF